VPFFQAGADAVIASQWSVLDASTLILMARFYYLWRVKKLTAAEALRQSQLWMRTTPDRVKAYNLRNVLPKSMIRELAKSKRGVTVHDHPEHWAAFTYVGP
jgi:CHAT domain-containing protein